MARKVVRRSQSKPQNNSGNKLSSPYTEEHFSFLKDLADIIKAKSILFSPIYLAYVTFLITKVEYVSESTIISQLIILNGFISATFYAYILTKSLWMLEVMRFFTNQEISSKGELLRSLPPEDHEKFLETLKSLNDVVSFENKLYRYTMYSIYFAAFSTLINIYFGGFMKKYIEILLIYASGILTK